MATIQEKTKMSFVIRKELKDRFYKMAEDMETTPSNLLNMLISTNLRKKELIFVTGERDEDFCEIEPLDTSDWGGDFQKKAAQLQERSKDIFTKLKKE